VRERLQKGSPNTTNKHIKINENFKTEDTFKAEFPHDTLGALRIDIDVVRDIGFDDARLSPDNERLPPPKDINKLAIGWLRNDVGKEALQTEFGLDYAVDEDGCAIKAPTQADANEWARAAGCDAIPDVIDQLARAPKDAHEGKSGSGSEPAPETSKPRTHTRRKKAKAKSKAKAAPEPEPAARAQDNEIGGTAAPDAETQPNGDTTDAGPRKKGKAGSITYIGGTQKRITTIEDLQLRYALLHAPGVPSVFISRRDFLPIQDADLKRRVSCEVAQTGEKDGKPVYTDASVLLMRDSRRHIYRSIDFTSKTLPGDVYNLYCGLGVTPRQGKCNLILQHIKEVICSGDEVNFEAMVNLLAWQIQNIGKPSRIVVVLHNPKQQAGKGMLLEEVMLKIYGPSGFPPSSVDQVLGRFNDTIRGKAFIFMDEVLFAGDLRAADAVKALATTTMKGIETKGLPIVTFPVAVNLWLASNSDSAVHIEPGDARYWILKVSEHRIGDHAYFARLEAQIKEEGGREAFAHYLLTRDVSGFVPKRDVPLDNAERRQMIRQSLNPYDARVWLGDCAAAEQILGSEKSWSEGDELIFEFFVGAYTKWQQTVKTRVAPKPTPIGSLGGVLSKAGFEPGRNKLSRWRVVPATATCLRALADLGK
jgi:hypothetical protein